MVLKVKRKNVIRFIRKPWSNPLLRLFDLVTETAFSMGTEKQYRLEAPVMDKQRYLNRIVAPAPS